MVTHLLCRCEDMSSDPQHPCAGWDGSLHACAWVGIGRDRGFSGTRRIMKAHWLAGLVQVLSSRCSERP